MNRRSILGFIAGAPVAGAAVADAVVKSQLNSPISFPPSHPYPTTGLASGTTLAQAQLPSALMSRENAMRRIFGDAGALAAIRDELFAQNRVITAVDPDIMVMRSWSPMAKIAFQRQRNVERALQDLQFGDWTRPQYFLRTIEDRLNKLMWGRDGP